MSYPCMLNLQLLFIFSLGKAERPFNQKKKPPSPILCALIMNMLSGQGHPDVFWWLIILFYSFASYFWIQNLRFVNETLGPFPQSNYHVKQFEKLMVISSWGYLNWTLKHIVQRNTCNKRVNTITIRGIKFLVEGKSKKKRNN